jgi:hypothetical protein
VLPELADIGSLQGLAFVDDDEVRFQAPDEPGTYSAVYTIGDDFEQTARATITFTVVAKDAGENRPPLPTPLTSRTFAGSAVSIDIPLDGLDPDGDSVVLTGISSARTSAASPSARARRSPTRRSPGRPAPTRSPTSCATRSGPPRRAPSASA